MPTNGPKVYTVRKLCTFTEDQRDTIARLAKKYGGSEREVVRAGIAALVREHRRATGEIVPSRRIPDGED